MDTATVHISTIERKSRMRKWTIIALIALMTSPLYAETITLDEALQAAQATNTDIEVARIQLEGELREAGFSSSLIPDISLVGGYSWSNASILDQNTGTGAGTLSLGIEWDIGSSLVTEAKVKDLQGQVAALDFLNASQTVEEAVVAAYWAVASAQDQVESATLALEAAQESLELVTSRYESGLVDEIELSQAKLEVLEYQSTLVTAENAYQSACIAFSLLTGLGSDGFETEEIEELGTFTSQGLESLLSAATSGNTSLQSLRKEVDLAQANSLDTMADYQLPRVQLSANYSLGGSGVTNLSGLASDNASVSVALTVPISSWIPGSAGSNAVQSARDQEEIARLNLESGNRQVDSDVRGGLADLEEASLSASIAAESLILAQRSYELTLERYDNGYVSYSDVSDARRQMVDAQLTLSSSRVDQMEALWALSFDTGLGVDELKSLCFEN